MNEVVADARSDSRSLKQLAAKLSPGLARRVRFADAVREVSNNSDSDNHRHLAPPAHHDHRHDHHDHRHDHHHDHHHDDPQLWSRWKRPARARSQSSGSDNPELDGGQPPPQRVPGEQVKSAPLPRKAPRRARSPKRHSDGEPDSSPPLGRFRSNTTRSHGDGAANGSRVHSEKDQDGWAVLREVVGDSAQPWGPRPPHRVLMVVVDDSPLSLLTLRKALECKRPFDELFVCHPTTAAPASTHAPDEASLADATQQVCVKFHKLTARVPHVHTLVLCAPDPYVEVGRLAEQMGVHTLFVGEPNAATGGRWFRRKKKRNPALAFAAACKCDVMLVRERP